jgi:hypothetical protein
MRATTKSLTMRQSQRHNIEKTADNRPKNKGEKYKHTMLLLNGGHFSLGKQPAPRRKSIYPARDAVNQTKRSSIQRVVAQRYRTLF